MALSSAVFAIRHAKRAPVAIGGQGNLLSMTTIGRPEFDGSPLRVL
jgi:hypothetical protein